MEAGATEISATEDGVGSNDDETKTSIVSETTEAVGDIKVDDGAEHREQTEAEMDASPATDDSIHLTFPNDSGRSNDGADSSDGIL